MAIAILLIVLLIAMVILATKKDSPDKPSFLICTACGSRKGTKTVTRGSIGVELLLWLCFLVPGLIYSIWRLTTRHEACRMCESTQLVPISTPAGRALADKYQQEP